MSVAPPTPIRNSETTSHCNFGTSSPDKTSSHQSNFIQLGSESKVGTFDEKFPLTTPGESATKPQHLALDKIVCPSPAVVTESVTNTPMNATLQISASILQGMSLTSSDPKTSSATSLNVNENKTRAEEIDCVDDEVIRPTEHSADGPNACFQHRYDETSIFFQSKPLQSTPNRMRDQPKDPIPLRRGKWTAEEEAYASAVIEAFSSGYLDALPGTTLRTYLSEKLQCDPMRITKKFTGDYSIGKKVFHPVPRNEATIKIMEETQIHLNYLFEEWKKRLESQRQESTRKSLAAEAVSAVSALTGDSYRESPHSSSLIVLESFFASVGKPEKRVTTDQIDSEKRRRIHNTIVRTVSWLEQAESVLSKNSLDTLTHYCRAMPAFRQENIFRHRNLGGNSSSSQFITKIELEMKEITQLINEGPTVVSNSRVIPTVLGKAHQIHGYSCRPNLHCPSSSDCQHPFQIHPSQDNRNSWRVMQREMGRMPPVIDEETFPDSPTNPMKILASLSSQAAPVPIVDDDDEGKVKRIAPSQRTDHVSTNEWKSNKRFKVQRTKSASAIENSSGGNADAEDARTFVDFLHSVVRVQD